VRAHSIHKTYQESKASEPTLALRGITVDFEPGTMTALMGPSGSGKSTLLYCLAGLEEPSSGTSHILDRDVATMSKRDAAIFRRDHVGFVFQAYNLIPSIDVYENVALPARLAGRPVDDAVIRRTLDQIGLGAKLHTMPGRLSGGQQQRVAIARVIASQPQVVFADEPTGALDSTSGDAVLDLLQGIPAQHGQCVVMATHDPNAAARCDRVVFMKDGQLVTTLEKPNADSVAAMLTHLRASTTPQGS
jgi:putative ABC transport system ATP-binding protein